MRIPHSKADLDQLVADQVQESIHLDYKDSRALLNNTSSSELSKDVSAFANSDGGVIIYGVREENHRPIAIDDGVLDTDIGKERIEQILMSNIAPRIDGVIIHRIPLSVSQSAYAIEVPKSYRAPHQDRHSKKYYKRFNYLSHAMEDYELADIRARSRQIAPLVSFEVEVQHDLLFFFLISNPGDIPAHDVRFSFSETLSWDKEEPPIVRKGIGLLPPGREYRLLYGVSYEIFAPERSACTRFEASVSYFHPVIQQRISETTLIDLNDYLGTFSAQNRIEDLEKALQKSIGEVRDELRKIAQLLTGLSTVAGPTGLQISSQTIRNLATSFGHQAHLERQSPYARPPAFFVELLGVDIALARRLAQHFRRSDPPDIATIEGMTPEALSAIRELLMLDPT